MLFTIFITVRCLDEIWTSWNNFPPASPTFLSYILVLFSHVRYSTRFHSLSFPIKLMPAFLSFLVCTTCPAYLILVYEQKVLHHIKLISCIKSILINFVWTGANLCICIASVGHNPGIISGYIQLNDGILQYALREVKGEEGVAC